MNQKIRELAEQADCKIDRLGYGEGDLEKFAELIVRECAQVCINLQDIPATEPRHCAEDIKIHFGVEE
jgi:hypothetical protein